MNKLIFGMDCLNVVQGYGTGWTHGKHTDYPIDIMGASSSQREWFYCPCDEAIVKRIYGVRAEGVNTVWVQSQSKVDLADGTTDYVTMLFTHVDDDDLLKLKEGQHFHRNEKMFREGNDGADRGFSTGNHLHMSVSKGLFFGNGWKQNKNGAWDITGKPIKPEKAFFINSECKVLATMGLDFIREKKETQFPITFHIGDKVILKNGAVYSGASAGKKVPSMYIGKTFTVQETNTINILVKELNSWIPLVFIEKE